MANIKPAADGPFLASGIDRVTRFKDGEVFEVEGSCALCRCGGSSNKPFCDGTHSSNGFSGAKDPAHQPDKIDDYAGAEVTIHDNRSLCAHAGYCTDGLKEVFKLGQEPWIDPDGAAKEEIIKAVENCPSGALSYSLSTGSGPVLAGKSPGLEDDERQMGSESGGGSSEAGKSASNHPAPDSRHPTSDTLDARGRPVQRGPASPTPSIAFAPNGPYVCRGGCELEGAEFPKGGTQEKFTLCRCGQSTVKPFCSGAHWNHKFDEDA